MTPPDRDQQVGQFPKKPGDRIVGRSSGREGVLIEHDVRQGQPGWSFEMAGRRAWLPTAEFDQGFRVIPDQQVGKAVEERLERLAAGFDAEAQRAQSADEAEAFRLAFEMARSAKAGILAAIQPFLVQSSLSAVDIKQIREWADHLDADFNWIATDLREICDRAEKSSASPQPEDRGRLEEIFNERSDEWPIATAESQRQFDPSVGERIFGQPEDRGGEEEGDWQPVTIHRCGGGQYIVVDPENIPPSGFLEGSFRLYQPAPTQLQLSDETYDFEFFSDSQGQVRWRLLGRRGRVVATSDVSYRTEQIATRAVEDLRNGLIGTAAPQLSDESRTVEATPWEDVADV